MEMSEGTSRSSSVVKLFCPSLSQLVPLRVESVKGKLDLGAIARAFGIEPATLKLNDHFISRGADLIACSVTWNSLISFFAKRGLSTGTNDGDALIVDGKLCKPGTKRVHGHIEIENHHPKAVYNENGTKRKSQLDEVVMLKKNKIGASSDRPADNNEIGLKRKSWLDDLNPLKKTRMNRNCSGSQKDPFDANSGIPSGCHYFNKSIKRVREDELIAATPCKRTR